MKYVLMFVGTMDDQRRWDEQAQEMAGRWPGGPVEVWPAVER